MADAHKYSVQEALNIVLNTAEDALKVDIDNVTLTTEGSDINLEVHTDKAEDSMLMFSHTVKTGSGGTSYVPLVDSDGHLQVDILSGSTATTEYSEDAATPSTISGVSIMMERDDALSSLTPAEGDWVALRSSAEGALWTQEFNSDAILADTANMDTNLGTVAGAVSSGQMQVDVVASIPAGDNNIGNVDIVTLPASTNTIEVVGDAAENAAVAGNPVLVGGRYDSSARTLGDGDAGAIALDADGAVHIADGGNAITVDGTVTANLSATDNAVLDAIDSNTDYGATTGGGAESGALRVTIANDSTGVVSVDDGGGALTVDGTVTANLSATDNAVLDTIDAVLDNILTKNTEIDAVLDTIDADTGAIKTAVEIIDNAISGSEMQVDAVSNVQPAGFGSIGHGKNDAVGTSAEVLASSQACKHIDVMAAIANTGIIYVGGSGVTAADGIGLYAGDVYSLDIDNVNDVYVVASVNGEDVQYVYYS